MPSVNIRRTSPPIRGRLGLAPRPVARGDEKKSIRYTTGRLLSAPRRKAPEQPPTPALDDGAIAMLSAPEVLAQLIVLRRDLDAIAGRMKSFASIDGVVKLVGEVQRRFAGGRHA
ncbi:MAG: hypothetical protein H6961_11670 [Chromatiaceae bacterium]|nr:hypothetical protein [Chromatiaceae bacterium]